MNRPRLGLPISAWSTADQAALRMATTPGLRRERAGRAARWQPDTVKIMVEGVGHYLGFLASSGLDVTAVDLKLLCTEGRVHDWIAAMRGRKRKGHTIRFRVTGLQRGCEVMHPFADWGWLRQNVAELPDGKFESRERKRRQLRHSRELLELGLRLIRESLSCRFLRPHLKHVQARDGMMIALLAARPLRIKNFTALRLGVHLTRREDGRWRLYVPPAETKNAETIDDVLPADIGLLLDRYQQADRPALLARRQTGSDSEDHLWISEDGLPMTSQSIRLRIREQTFKAFGVAISPHRFRDAGATTIAIELPAEIGMALPLLGNRDANTIEAHYNMATTLQAAQRLNDSLEATMRDLGLR